MDSQRPQIRRDIPCCAGMSLHRLPGLPGHLQSRRKPESLGFVSLRDEDFRFLSALARSRLERLDEAGTPYEERGAL